MKRTITIAALALTSTLVLSACADNTEGENTDTTTIATTSAPDTTETTGPPRILRQRRGRPERSPPSTMTRTSCSRR